MKLTEIIKIKGDWAEVLDDARLTAGKESLGKEPSNEWKREILISEHSPIRALIFKWDWRSIMTWVATHWVRHKWESLVKTQRTDRTGIDRNRLYQSELVNFRGEANTQHLIDTWRKRLCNQASPETRALAEDFKAVIHEIEPEVSDVLVPNCVYRCGCPEKTPCGKWRSFSAWMDRKYGFNPGGLTIQMRYDLYNEWFYEQRKGGESDV